MAIIKTLTGRLLVCLMLGAPGVSPAAAQSVDWRTAIEKVRQSAEAYFESASEAGGTSWAGSAYVGYEFDRHQCAILGRMLGQQEAITALETMPYPPMDQTSDPHDLLVFSISLENWVLAAERALDMGEAERRNVWNLDCVDLFGISTCVSEMGLRFKESSGLV